MNNIGHDPASKDRYAHRVTDQSNIAKNKYYIILRPKISPFFQ